MVLFRSRDRRAPGLLERDGIFLDVFFDGGAARAAADMVERLGILDAMFLPQGAMTGQDELLDVIAVGGNVVVA